MLSAEILVESLGHVIPKQLGLKASYLGRLLRIIKLGAYLHDWGKANQHFQAMVYLKSGNLERDVKKKIAKLWNRESQQMIRHEFLSGILALQVPDFREWLRTEFTEEELILAVWAAIGHHLKAGVDENEKESHKITTLPDGAGSELEIYTGHSDFQAVLRLGSQKLGLPEVIPNVSTFYWAKEDLQDHLSHLQNQFRQVAQGLTFEDQVMVGAIKATVIAADLAGSSVPLIQENLRDWISNALSLTLTSEELQELVHQRLGNHSLRPFQQQIAATPDRVTLVKAGCGTGKTIGAYAWAQQWAVGKRLFFGYPTTGTATQGYLDYANDSPIESLLMHSRADMDRELLFTGEGDDAEGIPARLQAFQTWRKKLVVCTVDSILGLIQNNRRPLFAWPALVQSAFVFDEVHAYDKSLFGALLQFLKAFRGAPILLMSASFTPGQLRAIQQVMEEIGEPLGDPIEGPQELEQLKRYQLQTVEVEGDPVQSDRIWAEVKQAVQSGQKVLWVTNSVSTCIDIYHLAKQNLSEFKQPILIYHSRFRYKDRVKKHEQVIEAFKSSQGVFSVTTQVCEMSLDLSADLLVSAMAPAAALIQRLGRLNRRMIDARQGSRVALFYDWDQSKPYKSDELATGKQFLESLNNYQKVSQQDLAKVASQLNQETPEPIKSAWIQGDYCSYQKSLREGGYTITVLLNEDEPEIWKATEERVQEAQLKGEMLSKMQAFLREAQAWAVPIRIPHEKTEWWNWQRRGFYRITEQGYITYSDEVGTP
ncbi:MAG: CRISPR-associated helicase Cas3' [Synechococcaceae cyanobacterium SM2_3_1]|nr:CRISPR-associated helicase Cas3' [Synechococcaceae cyanobacterium SM2_3_1]